MNALSLANTPARWAARFAGLIGGALVLLLLTSVSAQAATCTFASVGDDDWDTAANWDCGVVPSDADDVIIPAATTTVISTGGLRIVNTLEVGAGSTLTGTSTSPSITFRVNVSTTNEGTITALGSTQLQFRGLTVNSGSIGGGSTFFDSLTNTGSVNTGSGILGISDDLNNTGGTVATTNRISFTGASSTTITGGISLSGGDIEIMKSDGVTVDVAGGNLITTADFLLRSGTLRVNHWTVGLSGSWINTGGVLDPSAGGNVYMDGAGVTISAEPGFYELQIDSGGTVTLTGDIEIREFLVLMAGELAADSHTITIQGTGPNADQPFRSTGGTFDPGTGTVVYTAENINNGSFIDLGSLDSFHNLVFQGTGIDYTLLAPIGVAGTLSIAADNIFYLDSFTLTVTGTITNLGSIQNVDDFVHPAESHAFTDSSGSIITTINSGGRLYLTLQDSNLNLNGTLVETVDVVISSPDTETITLTETGPATGIFRNTTGLNVVHVLGSTTPENGRFELTGDATLTSTYTDPYDGSEINLATVAASTTPVPAPAPASSGGGGLPAAPVQAPVTVYESITVDDTAIPAHTLLKLPCPAGAEVNHPCKAVYYLSTQGKRHAFPNDKVYFTWYENFDGVQLVNESQMSQIPLGSNITYKPGVKMVKFITDPKVYAVSKGGVLRWVKTQELATSLYGADWNTKIDDINDAFYANYRFGADIDTTADYSPSDAEASVTYPSDSLSM